MTTASTCVGNRSSPLIPFRLAGADDDTQREFLARINASKRVFLSSTMIGGRYVLGCAS
jgi:hypothetical protein